jgi:uncharacterized membrane protein
MAGLVEIAFPSEEKAEQVRQKLLDMQKEYLIELGDAVIAVSTPMAMSNSISSSIPPCPRQPPEPSGVR